MVFEFWPDVAPGTVKNFKKLAKTGYFDGQVNFCGFSLAFYAARRVLARPRSVCQLVQQVSSIAVTL